MIRALALFVALAALPVAAEELPLPATAKPVMTRTVPLDSYQLPIAPFNGHEIPRREYQGRVETLTWILVGQADTTLQLLKPLRDQLVQDGYDINLECADIDCGGFDFRFGIDVAPAPNMYVNLRNFRFLSASRGDSDAVSILVSVSRSASYIQKIEVTPG